MSLTSDNIGHIAHLARIAISPAEAQDVAQKLSGIFGLIDEMQKVDTRGVEPMAHAQDLTLRLRDDIVTETDQRDKLQANAPQSERGFFLVPKVIE